MTPVKDTHLQILERRISVDSLVAPVALRFSGEAGEPERIRAADTRSGAIPFLQKYDGLPPEEQHCVQSRLKDAIADVIDFIESHRHTTRQSDSIYRGTGGITWAYLRLVQQLPALNIAEDTHARLAGLLQEHADSSLAPSGAWKPRNCGDIGFLNRNTGGVVLALVLHLRGLRILDTDKLAALVEALISASDAFYVAPEGEDEGLDSEILNGRAGFLQGLLYLRHEIGSSSRTGPVPDALRQLVSDRSLADRVAVVVESGRAGASMFELKTPTGRRMPLVWRWSSSPYKVYLGAAHGVCGILLVLLQCPRTTWKAYEDLLLETVDCLVDFQQASGNWPSSVGSPNDDLVQWCHGAPGMVLLLSLLAGHDDFNLSASRRQIYVGALSAGARCVLKRGLLTKGPPNLCHGTAGSVYALLHASIATGDSGLLAQALSMALHAANWRELEQKGQMVRGDAPASLMCGVAGAACLWADLLCVVCGQRENFVGFPASLDIAQS